MSDDFITYPPGFKLSEDIRRDERRDDPSAFKTVRRAESVEVVGLGTRRRRDGSTGRFAQEWHTIFREPDQPNIRYKFCKPVDDLHVSTVSLLDLAMTRDIYELTKVIYYEKTERESDEEERWVDGLTGEVHVQKTGSDDDLPWIEERVFGYQRAAAKILGRGSYGKVLKVVDRNGQFAALKLMEFDKCMVSVDEDKNLIFNTFLQYFLKSFKNEILIGQAARGHPNVVQLLDHGLVNNYMYTFLEFCESRSLESLIPSLSGNEDLIKNYFVQICYGINQLHAHGIAHLDIKPENVLVKKVGDETIMKVSDFGISRVAFSKVDGLLVMESPVGTRPFMSPQQWHNIISNETNRPWIQYYPMYSDYWSLGVTLYSMLSNNRLPFRRPNNPEQIWPGLDPRTRELQVLLVPFMAMGDRDYTFESPEPSIDAQDLVAHLLEPDEFKRINFRCIFSHPWVQSYHKGAVHTLFDPPLRPYRFLKIDVPSFKRSRMRRLILQACGPISNEEMIENDIEMF